MAECGHRMVPGEATHAFRIIVCLFRCRAASDGPPTEHATRVVACTGRTGGELARPGSAVACLRGRSRLRGAAAVQRQPARPAASRQPHVGSAWPARVGADHGDLAGRPAERHRARGARAWHRCYRHLTLAQQVGQLFLVGGGRRLAGPRGAAGACGTITSGRCCCPKSADGTAALAAAAAAMQSLARRAPAASVLHRRQPGGRRGPAAHRAGIRRHAVRARPGRLAASALRAPASSWGTDLRAAGVNLNLAPVMDVVPAATAAANAPIGALDREFGFDPATNGAHGVAFIQGMAAAGVATVAKHFPGLGRVTGNTDFTPDVVDNVTTASDPDLDSFRAAIDAGVPMVMVALATYTQIDPSQLAVFSPVVMRLLRDGLGFTGVIVSDDLGQAKAVQAIPAAQPGDRLPRPRAATWSPRRASAPPSRWRPRCSPRRRVTPRSAPRSTPRRRGCSPPSRPPGCCRADTGSGQRRIAARPGSRSAGAVTGQGGPGTLERAKRAGNLTCCRREVRARRRDSAAGEISAGERHGDHWATGSGGCGSPPSCGGSRCGRSSSRSSPSRSSSSRAS